MYLIVLVSCVLVSCIFSFKRCPSNSQEWGEREFNFSCRDNLTKYHCMLDVRRQAVEFCSLEVLFEEKYGCPVYIGQNTKFMNFSCESDAKGCPNRLNGQYRSTDLYKYPACLEPAKNITSLSVEDKTYRTTDSITTERSFSVLKMRTTKRMSAKQGFRTRKSKIDLLAITVSGGLLGILVIVFIAAVFALVTNIKNSREFLRSLIWNEEISQCATQAPELSIYDEIEVAEHQL